MSQPIVVVYELGYSYQMTTLSPKMQGVFAPAEAAIKKEKTSNDLRHLHLQILHDYTQIYILYR